MTDKLDICGCCEGEERLTPAATYNPPGLGRLAYRAGTHAAFFETMIAQLARHEVVVKEIGQDGEEIEHRFRPLAALKTRRRDDFSIALLDAWSIIADVLTFYQERIANEGFLRTATERRSVLELARLVGYELAPGVAASTFLSFTVEESEGAALVPKGTRANCVPEPGETMQSFETMADLEARYDYNELPWRLTRPQFLRRPDVEPLPVLLYLPGQWNDLRPPARILLAFGTKGLNETLTFEKDDGYYLVRVKAAELLDNPARTRVQIEPEFNASRSTFTAEHHLAAFEMAGVKPTATYLELPWSEVQQAVCSSGVTTTQPPASVVPDAGGQDTGFQGAAALDSHFSDNIYGVLGQEVAPFPSEFEVDALRAAVVLRIQAHLHGHKAPWKGYSREGEIGTNGTRIFETVLSEWPNPKEGEDKDYAAAWTSLFLAERDDERPAVATLDRVYEEIGAGSLVVLTWRESAESHWSLFRVERIDQVGTGLFNVPATATRLALTKISGDDWQPTTMEVIRTTAVYAASELVRNPVPHRVLDVEPVPETHAVGEDEGWDEVADRYGLTPDLLAAANNLTEDDDLPATLLLPAGQELELDGIYRGIQPGRWVALRGLRADIPVDGQEAALVQAVEHRFARRLAADLQEGIDLPGDLRHTFLTLADPPSLPYRRGELRISANVVEATHGETARGVPPRDRDVILGSGDATQAHQRFALKIQPGSRLTYLPAPTATGVESTLEVYVGEVRWQSRDTLLGAGPTDHVYTVRTDDDGLPTVILGDGLVGARAPTGLENVWARYRIGIGKPGNVKAGQISLLAARPPGVKEVRNWVPAAAGADPESRDQARQRVPLVARSLDRLVSLEDYQDFARTFAGIAKALADWRPDATYEDEDGIERKGIVTVHVAGQDNIPLAGSKLLDNLKTALDNHDGSNVLIEVKEATARLISLQATVHIAPDRLWEMVKPAVHAALEERLGFDWRDMGQDVALSDVVQAIQAVPGVVHVQVTRLAALTADELRGQAANPLADQAEEPVAALLVVDDKEFAFVDPAVPSLIVLQQPQA